MTSQKTETITIKLTSEELLKLLGIPHGFKFKFASNYHCENGTFEFVFEKVQREE
jgi:hypothetical protein